MQGEGGREREGGVRESLSLWAAERLCSSCSHSWLSLLTSLALLTLMQKEVFVPSRSGPQQRKWKRMKAKPPPEHGLSKSFRQRLPIVPFDEKFLSTCHDTQCTVCLGEFQLGEKIQQLPACNHSFHVQCIDEWLARNVTCPICRTSVSVDQAGSGCVEEDVSNAMEQRRGDDHRSWEERVVSEAQDQSLFIRIDGTSNGDLPASGFDAGQRHLGEPVANRERS